MKIFFQAPDDPVAIEYGFRRRWDNFFDEIPKTGNNYNIVENKSLADFAILLHSDEYNSGEIYKIIRLLSKVDVETYTWDVSDRPTGRFSGFYCSLSKNLFDNNRHCSISYPGNFNERIKFFPLHDAKLDFSFMGQMTTGIRKKIVKSLSEKQLENNAVVQDSGNTVWYRPTPEYANSVAKAMQEYADLLRISKFVLCPRGVGTGSFRLFETMQAGRVPVIISDEYCRPAGIDWDSCSVTVRERNIAKIPEIIQGHLDDWEGLASNARAVWEANFSPQGIVDFIARNLQKMSPEISHQGFSPWRHSLNVGRAMVQERFRQKFERNMGWFKPG